MNLTIIKCPFCNSMDVTGKRSLYCYNCETAFGPDEALMEVLHMPEPDKGPSLEQIESLLARIEK